MANEEAAGLAEAHDNRGAPDREPEQKAKRLRVRVVKDGHPTVNVKVPIGVARWGMKMAQAFSPEMKDANLDWDSITAIIHEGEQGKIVEVEDEGSSGGVEADPGLVGQDGDRSGPSTAGSWRSMLGRRRAATTGTRP